MSVQKQYKASTNEIKSLPDTISIFWRTHLQEVDFSENCLKELPSYIFELEVSVMNWIRWVGGNKALHLQISANRYLIQYWSPIFHRVRRDSTGLAWCFVKMFQITTTRLLQFYLTVRRVAFLHSYCSVKRNTSFQPPKTQSFVLWPKDITRISQWCPSLFLSSSRSINITPFSVR